MTFICSGCKVEHERTYVRGAAFYCQPCFLRASFPDPTVVEAMFSQPLQSVMTEQNHSAIDDRIKKMLGVQATPSATAAEALPVARSKCMRSVFGPSNSRAAR